MTQSLDDTMRDPLDMTVTKVEGWVCQLCSVEQPQEATYCQMCLYARPLDRRGVPQIFSGYVIHFNGIIPRNLIHPSHSVEWRMAERHGAVCLPKFDTSLVNLLIYRPGYERSDKCRACVEKHPNIPAVPINWMLDSLLQSRQILPTLYRLMAIPEVANPTVRGTNLPHHQHPFYILNASDYAIPTSFPTRKGGKTGLNGQQTVQLAGTQDELPPFFKVEPLQHVMVDLFDAALASAAGKQRRIYVESHNGSNTTDEDDEDEDEYNADEIEARKESAGLELLASQQSRSRVDKMLFAGMTFMLTPSLQAKDNLLRAVQMCGAKIASSAESADAIQAAKPTHIIYAREDKKCPLMLVAAQLVGAKMPSLHLAQVNWLEDCLILGEVVPPYGMYSPTAKLMETLKNKYERQNR